MSFYLRYSYSRHLGCWGWGNCASEVSRPKISCAYQKLCVEFHQSTHALLEQLWR